MDLFVILYRAKYKREPVMNKIQAKYDVVELIGILNFYEVQELIEFYFKIDVDKPSLRNFLYSYEEIKEMMQEREEDICRRRALMNQTRARVEEYKAREQRSKTTELDPE